MSNIISFASLVVRDITAVNAPKYGNWSLSSTEIASDINAIDFDQLVYCSRLEKGPTALADYREDFVDQDAFLVGGSNHIQHRVFFAVASD